MFISVEDSILNERKPVPAKHQRSTLSELLCVKSHCVFDRGPCHACWNVVSHLWGMLAKGQWIHTSASASFRTQTKKMADVGIEICCLDEKTLAHACLTKTIWARLFLMHSDPTICPPSLYCGDPRLEAQKMWYHQSQHLKPPTICDTIGFIGWIQNSIPKIDHSCFFWVSRTHKSDPKKKTELPGRCWFNLYIVLSAFILSQKCQRC